MVTWKVGDAVDYEVCSAASEMPRRRCAENSTTRLHDGVEATRRQCPAGERDLVSRIHRAQRLEEALLQVRGVEVQELRGAHRQGEPRRPRAAPRGLGQWPSGRRQKEEAGGQEVVRARRPWSEGASMASIGPRRRPAKKPARKPAAKSPAKKKTVAKPAAKKPAVKKPAAKKSCEPAPTAAP